MPNNKQGKVKKKSSKRKVNIPEIKVEQIHLLNRQVFLTGEIDEKQAHEIITTLTALDLYEKAPITLWINSPGGSVYDGFAIIDTMLGLNSAIVTIITGKAFSMAGIISIFGDKRAMTKNSSWMAHDVASWNADYVTKMKARFKNTEKLQSKVFQMLRDSTKLTEKDLETARHEELWLDADECLQKGIVDLIIG